jgi:hypothetical protein
LIKKAQIFLEDGRLDEALSNIRDAECCLFRFSLDLQGFEKNQEPVIINRENFMESLKFQVEFIEQIEVYFSEELENSKAKGILNRARELLYEAQRSLMEDNLKRAKFQSKTAQRLIWDAIEIAHIKIDINSQAIKLLTLIKKTLKKRISFVERENAKLLRIVQSFKNLEAIQFLASSEKFLSLAEKNLLEGRFRLCVRNLNIAERLSSKASLAISDSKSSKGLIRERVFRLELFFKRVKKMVNTSKSSQAKKYMDSAEKKINALQLYIKNGDFKDIMNLIEDAELIIKDALILIKDESTIKKNVIKCAMKLGEEIKRTKSLLIGSEKEKDFVWYLRKAKLYYERANKHIEREDFIEAYKDILIGGRYLIEARKIGTSTPE